MKIKEIKKIHLLQPSIIKSYMEMYSYDINDNKIKSKKKS